MTSSSEAAAKPVSAPIETRRVGKYELQKQLGAGGMGTVYLAKDIKLKRLVALKVLPKDKAKNATLVRRFMAEAQAAAQLRNDHIVAIYENGEADGHQFIAMEYVDGTDLHELIRKRGKIPAKRSLEIIKQVVEALQHAYEHNIVHRDIKPSNLLIRNDGQVKLTDLGLARSIDDTLETDITRAGTTVGTVDYMSPEQGRSSKAADIRSDIYSLGCTWYHMLTGKPPYAEGSMTNKLQAHATAMIPNPRDENDNVTEAMVAVLQRMMSKKPEDRYQTPDELLKDLSSPTLTRGGMAQEVLTAINEEYDDTVVAPKEPRRKSPAGLMPPKNKQTKETDEDDKPSWLDWETLQPLAWGAGLLLAVAAIGSIVAYFTGTLDFGSGKIAQTDQRPKGSDQNVVQSPKTDGAAVQPGQAPNLQPDVLIVNSPMPDNPNPDGTPGAQPMPDGTTTQTTITSPGDPSANPGDPANLDSPTVPGDVAQMPGNFDPEEIPEWSTEPSARAQQGLASNSPNSPNSSGSNPSSASPKSAGNPKSSNTPNNPSTPNSPANPNSPVTPNSPVRPNPSGTSPKNAPPDFAMATSKTFSVGPGVATATHFRTLAEALKSAPPEGAVIRLTSTGPYFLPNVALKQVRRLSLFADEGQQPIILLRPTEGEATAGLQLAQGVLELEGLHFALDRSVFAGSDPVQIVTSIDGQLLVRQCSFSIWGTGTVPVRALTVQSLAEPQGVASVLAPRVLIDQVTIQGDNVTSLDVSRPTADIVIRESLLAGGQQPVIALSGSMPGHLTSGPNAKPRRAVRIVQSTLYADRTVFQVASDDSKSAPPTAIFLQDSVCATAKPASETVLLDAASWPQAAGLQGLAWTMKDSSIVGFGRLAALGANSAVQGWDEWQKFWGKELDPAGFIPDAWPSGATADLSSLPLKTFDRATLPANSARRADQTPPGCDLSLLADFHASRRWLSALIAKPAFPEPVTAAAPNVVKLDISKQQDLGSLLQSGTWPAGTVLELTGTGLKQMSPVKLVGKSWTIVWRPQEGQPLTLTPKLSSGELSALFVVERGSLEIENVRFQAPSAKKSTLQSLIAARNARLRLENVWMQGLMADSNTLDSLLRWTSDEGNDGGETPYLACRDCLFSGSGSLIRLDLGTAPAFLRNCLLVTRADAIDVRFSPLPTGKSGAPLLADHLTISAAQAAFRLKGDANETGGAPHRFYVDNSVIAPPLANKDEKTPTLFSLGNPASDLARIEWWGQANGVSAEVLSFVRPERDGKPNLSEVGLSRWQSAWSEEQDARLLTGAGGVVMTEQFTNKPATIKPSQFGLHSNAKASKWAEGGGAIGIDLRQLEMLPAAAKPKDAKTPATQKKTPAKNQPDF